MPEVNKVHGPLQVLNKCLLNDGWKMHRHYSDIAMQILHNQCTTRRRWETGYNQNEIKWNEICHLSVKMSVKMTEICQSKMK